MDIVFVGAGRLATQFAQALSETGHEIAAVYSRTMNSAEALTSLVGGVATCNVELLPVNADAYIVAVKDSAIAGLLPQLLKGREEQCFFHTAGSVPMSVFADAGYVHYGVVYPLQTFSKERKVSFESVPFFLEANDYSTLQLARLLATSVSKHVHTISSEERCHLHLAAVFACNFVNHCYNLSAQILERQGLTFDVMLPLIEETARKVETMQPRDAQTGPAVRYDEQVIAAQRFMLNYDKRLQAIYTLLSDSIHQSYLSYHNAKK